MQEGAHSGAYVRDALGVCGGLHGAASNAADAAGPPSGERAPHHADSTRRATLLQGHARRLILLTT